MLAAEFNTMARTIEGRDRTLVERADELNRLSRYLASVLDSLEDALIVVEDERVTRANPAAQRLWGASSDSPAPEPVAMLLDQPGRHEQTADGHIYEIRVTPFGQNGAVVVSADVTEQTHTRTRLARSERLALIGQMLAQITHEVRNPLNALSLNNEMLADEVAALDPTRRSEAWVLLDMVSNEIERLTALTGHYLQLARRPPAQLEPHDLGALVTEVVRLLTPELEARGVELEVEVESMPPQLVDGNQMRQALLNVVRNATEVDAKKLVLAAHRSGGDVHLALTDDGPGMTAEQADRATDPFYSSKADGTGLGLAITKQILEDHDGTVRIESQIGGGTTITLLLPDRPGDILSIA
jgi:signal transduction histidine kinase